MDSTIAPASAPRTAATPQLQHHGHHHDSFSTMDSCATPASAPRTVASHSRSAAISLNEDSAPWTAPPPQLQHHGQWHHSVPFPTALQSQLQHHGQLHHSSITVTLWIRHGLPHHSTAVSLTKDAEPRTALWHWPQNHGQHLGRPNPARFST